MGDLGIPNHSFTYFVPIPYGRGGVGRRRSNGSPPPPSVLVLLGIFSHHYRPTPQKCKQPCTWIDRSLYSCDFQNGIFLKLCNKFVFQRGTVAHEIGHALGWHHEQSRPDRDDYVTINFDNVASGRNFNFYKYVTSSIATHDVPYDAGSIMHYGALVSSVFVFLDRFEPVIWDWAPALSWLRA